MKRLLISLLLFTGCATELHQGDIVRIYEPYTNVCVGEIGPPNGCSDPKSYDIIVIFCTMELADQTWFQAPQGSGFCASKENVYLMHSQNEGPHGRLK